MKQAINSFLLLLLVIAPIYSVYGGQTLLVTHEDGKFQVYGKSPREVRFTDPSASKAIQWAIDQAGKKGEVSLSRGIYVLNQPVDVKSGVRLTGQGRGTELRLTATNELAIRIQNAKRVQIDHLAVTPGDSKSDGTVGILLDGVDGCTISHVLAVGFSKYGLQVNYSQDCLIQKSYFVDNMKSNVFVENPKSTPKPIRIHNCFMLWGGGGVIAQGGEGLTVHSSVMQQINGVAFDIATDGFTVTGTRVFWSESLDQSVRVQGDDFKIANNIFAWSRGHSVVLDGAKDGAVLQNNIIDVGPPPRDGSFMSCIVLQNGTEDVAMTQNALFNWDDWTQGPMAWGIEESADCQNNTITDNNIHFYHEGDINSNGKNTVVERNVSDPGRDDQRLLPDFDVWRPRVRDFIDNSLLMSNVDPETGGQDLLVEPLEGAFQVRKAVTGEVILKESSPVTAIDKAIDYLGRLGGSITLAEGSYPIDRTIVVKANIWLRGKGESTIVQPAADMDACIRVYKAPQALVSDLKVMQPSDGPKAQTGIAIRHTVTAQIIRVSIDGFTQYGVYLEGDPEDVPQGNWGPTAGPGLILVNGCRITNNQSDNVFIETSGSYIGNAIPVVISDNLIVGGGTGVHNWAICSNVVDNVIVQTRSFGMLQMANSILTTGNVYYQTGRSAISAYDGIEQIMHPTYDRRDNNNNKECNITNNVILEPRGHGIEVSEQWGTISGNRIVNVGSGTVASHFGIWLHEDSESYIVAGNITANYPGHPLMLNGIRESGRKNLISTNVIRGCQGDAIVSSGYQSFVSDNSGEPSPQAGEVLDWKLDTKIKLSASKESIQNYIYKKLEKIEKK